MLFTYKVPILFLIFNRAENAQRVFNQIKEVRPKYLFVAADGPRQNHPEDLKLCSETRQIINQIDWDCEIKTLFRETNLGCGLAVSSAISWFFENVEEGIILEDDCFPEITFFHFCEELLSEYRDDDSVYMISGTNLYNNADLDKSGYYFSNYTITWGWASWRRAWRQFSHDVVDYESAFNSDDLKHVFQSIQEKRYWKKKIRKAIFEKKNIWDYHWFFTIWKNRGLGITPNVNLVTNIGFREGGSHNFLKDSLREPIISSSISFPVIHPQKHVNRVADKYIFENAFSYSWLRLLRLIKENGIFAVTKYVVNKIIDRH